MALQDTLLRFKQDDLLSVARCLFEKELRIPLSPLADAPLSANMVLKDAYRPDRHAVVKELFLVGMVDDQAFADEAAMRSLNDLEAGCEEDYEGLILLAVDLALEHPTRAELAGLTRDFNRAFKAMPVVVVFRYDHTQTCISLSSCERRAYQQDWREGQKLGKISLLKDVAVSEPHAAHMRILESLAIPRTGANAVRNFRDLHAFWRTRFDSRELNRDFYRQVAAWYYHAVNTIKLPIKPDYCDSDESNVKNFAVRLISRLMFCWFLKEKKLISAELLELTRFDGQRLPLVTDVDTKDEAFMSSNSYYRGILQNIFFSSLNSPMVDKLAGRVELYGAKYLHPDFDTDALNHIPYLNAALFEKSEADNCNDRVEDGPFAVPNELFYAEELEVTMGQGRNATVKTRGLNRLFAQYKFTIEENTALEEEVALDPELLGMVFENLLAEIDPNEDGSAKSARKEQGAYYTPRRIIDYMVNESLRIYLRNAFGFREGTMPAGTDEKISNLLCFDEFDSDDAEFISGIIDAFDVIKVLDPACGSGAFPVGMLNRMVELLRMVDPDNRLWIEKQVSRLPAEMHAQAREDFSRHDFNYVRKLGLIRNTIYGIDIQPMAVMITKLRFFISLLIDQEIDAEDAGSNFGITAMPNVETKVICANSLNSFQPNLFETSALEHIKADRERYYNNQALSPADKEALLVDLSERMDAAFPDFYRPIVGRAYTDEPSRRAANLKCLRDWIHFGAMAAPFFDLDYFFPEVAEQDGFDIVIGNPPYGGTKIDNDLKTAMGLGSRDPYGAFVSRFVANHPPLKTHGVLAYIVSDTFMTIKTHKPLRKQLMQSYIHRMVRVHPDTFKATVNTVVMVVEREEGERDQDHACLMADLTNVSIHENYTRFLHLLYRTTEAVGQEGDDVEAHVMSGEDWRSESSEEYALYHYPQQLIATNSNVPFFVASPKLFALMNDQTADAEYREIGGNRVQVRKIPMNGSDVEVVKLGDIAEVKVGLQTGDNEAYLFQNLEAWGTYRDINEYADKLLTEEDLERIRSDETLRMDVIGNGISTDDSNSFRYFGGRYIIPHDKGGEGDANSGWLPNYHVDTNYYIDWSEWAVDRIKTLCGRNGRPMSRFQNTAYYFLNGIDYSQTGVYCPTFRLNSGAVFNTEATSIFSDVDIYRLLSVLCGKMNKFFVKNCIDNTVHASADKLKETAVLASVDELETRALVNELIEHQINEARYDYASNEQLEIDRLIYEAYGLNADDIQEVENWYARRYPRLVAAQCRNLAEANGE